KKMMQLIRRMQPGDMPDFQPAMRLMLNGLINTKASMRHAIMISDGDPSPPTAALLQKYKDNNIKISTVGVGTHGPAMRKELKAIADATGGKYWHVTNPKALPKIYQREARRVSKPVIKESATGMSAIPVQGTGSHEIVQNIDVGSLPPFNGYVMTTIKKSGLVEQLAIASDPDDKGENSTLLASWRYGNGRTIAFTSDAGNKWTSRWFNDAQYDKLFVQMMRYAMRPITEDGDFTVSTELKDGVARIVVSAMDGDENLLDFLQMNGTGIYSGDADSKPVALQFEQIRPGRYMAEHEVTGKGNLLYSVLPGEGYEKLTFGLNVPYSSEYSDRESNLALLGELAALEPQGGEVGKMSAASLAPATVATLIEQNTFRPTLTNSISIQDIWPFLLMLGTAIFFSDVFVRRVAVQWWAIGLALALAMPIAWMFYFGSKWWETRNSFGPAVSLWQDEMSAPLFVASLFGGFASLFLAFLLSTEGFEQKMKHVIGWFVKKDGEPEAASIARLQSRKAEIEKDIETRRAATKFEPTVDDSSKKVSGSKKLEQVIGNEIEKTPALPPKIKRDEESDGESYTSRLLDAKRKLKKKRERNQGE
ncbi:VWA domain-containing protein, partial [Mariniblastus sp.]|nr:VWA domain-containing protein [Mariniblastus sp.]